MKDVAKFTGMLSIAAAVKAGFEGKQSLFKGKRDEAGLSTILCAGHHRTVLVACACLGDTWACSGKLAGLPPGSFIIHRDCGSGSTRRK